LLDQYLAGEIGEEYLIDKARAWRNYRSSYRPLVEFARERRLPVIAANAPKQMVVCVGRSGLEVLDKYPLEQRRHVAQNMDVSDGAYKRKFLGAMSGSSAHKSHGSGDSYKIMQTMSRRSFMAQALRDDTMAESITRHLQQNPGRQVLHLNGNFHSSAFLGTVERLQKRMPALKIPAPLGRCHPRTVVAVRREHPEETGEADSRFRHQVCQPGNEVQWLEDDVRCAVAVRRLQLVAYISVQGERQALFRDSRPADVAT
jgi:hypothetical protein